MVHQFRLYRTSIGLDQIYREYVSLSDTPGVDTYPRDIDSPEPGLTMARDSSCAATPWYV